MKTRLTKLLGIEKPVVQGGMAWISDAKLAAAVSNAGGLGIIAAGSAPAEYVRGQVREAKKLTSKPFGVNIMLLSPHLEEIAEMVVCEGVGIVTTGAGNPGIYMGMWKAAGIKVIPVVPTVAYAKRLERAGADALVAEGCEAGGHIGELTTMAMLPQIADAVSVPLIAAGGIADGRGMAAAFMLGACGVQMGTRFLVAEECSAHENYKQKVLQATDTRSTVTGRPTGHPVRCLKNRLSRQFKELEEKAMPLSEYEKLGMDSLRRAAKEGDVLRGSVMAGQIAGLVNKKQSAGEIINEICSVAQELLSGGGSL